MENQINNLQELEELRSQVAEFKNRMDKQEIVSRHLLNEAMKGHVSWIKQMSFGGGIVNLALVPLVVFQTQRQTRYFYYNPNPSALDSMAFVRRLLWHRRSPPFVSQQNRC